MWMPLNSLMIINMKSSLYSHYSFRNNKLPTSKVVLESLMTKGRVETLILNNYRKVKLHDLADVVYISKQFVYKKTLIKVDTPRTHYSEKRNF